MLVNIIYILILIILTFVIIIALKAVDRGVKSKKKKNK